MNEFLFLFQKLVILDYIIRNTGINFHILLHFIETRTLGTKWIFICSGLLYAEFSHRRYDHILNRFEILFVMHIGMN